MPTHGALSKAGKVRSLSASKGGKAKSKPNPRVKNKRKYNNLTTVSSYKGESVNITLADVGIRVDTEDDSRSVGALNAGAQLFPNPSF